MPCRILGLDSDSGSEFLNAPLVDYCAAQRITFTRGRPYRKNDSCFRRAEELRCCASPRRLSAPRSTGASHPRARITRRHDAAQTPYRRLLAGGVLPSKTGRELTVRWAAVHPLRLKLELESA